MPARAITLANSVRDILNDASWTESFTATRDYDPFFELDELSELKVTVIPWQSERDIGATRGTDDKEIATSVGVQQRYDVDNKMDRCDELMILAEDIEDYFAGEREPSLNSLCVRVTRERFFDPAYLRQNHVFAAFIRLTWQLEV